MCRVMRGRLRGVEGLLGGVLLGEVLRGGRSRPPGTGVRIGAGLRQTTSARVALDRLHAGILRPQLRGPLLHGQSGCGDLRVIGNPRN